jgi:hypothetical protein
VVFVVCRSSLFIMCSLLLLVENAGVKCNLVVLVVVVLVLVMVLVPVLDMCTVLGIALVPIFVLVLVDYVSFVVLCYLLCVESAGVNCNILLLFLFVCCSLIVVCYCGLLVVENVGRECDIFVCFCWLKMRVSSATSLLFLLFFVSCSL